MGHIGHEFAAHSFQPADVGHIPEQKQHPSVFPVILEHRHAVEQQYLFFGIVNVAFLLDIFLAGNPFLDELRKFIVAFDVAVRSSQELIALDVQDALRLPVDQGDSARSVDHHDAAGHVGQHALQQIFVVMNPLELLLQAVRHPVDRLAQLADFVPAGKLDPGVVVQLGDAMRDARDLLQRTGHSRGDPVADEAGNEEQNQQPAGHQQPSLGEALFHGAQAHRQADVSVKSVRGGDAAGDVKHIFADRMAIADRAACTPTLR